MSRVFVLGAGSSKAVIRTAPLNKDLLSDTLKLRRDDRIKTVANFVKDFYSQNDPHRLPPLEDILTQLDICLVENRIISTDYNLTKLGELRENLVYGICRVLERALNSNMPNNLRLMQDFVEKLDSNDTIISLNYDLIVDNCMMRYPNVPSYSFPVRYYTDRYVDGTQEYWFDLTQDYRRRLSRKSRKVRTLLKLHGSLNWLYCPACRAIDVTPGVKGAVYIFHDDIPATCRSCGVRYDPYIVTPTFLKNYGNLYLNQIWQQAEERLSQATEIVFIGYSMPDADIILRAMFSRAVYRHQLLRDPDTDARLPLQRITVVDYNRSQNNFTRRRYQRLFGTITYFNQGFKYYVNEEM